MDDPAVGEVEMARSFRFIRAVNRSLGGISSLRSVFERDLRTWTRDRPIRWLDAGTGAADIPLAIDAWARRAGRTIHCVAVDNHPACLAVARGAIGDHPRIEVRRGDLRGLDRDLAGERFDYAHAGMVLHHLDDAAIVDALRAMATLARTIVWNDLLRSRWSRWAIRALTVASDESVRFDARLSVEKGFTTQEARTFAERAGLAVRDVRTRRILGRFVLIAHS